MALAAYRQVLRGISLAFQNDARVLAQARQQARTDFEAHRALDAHSHHARDRVQHAQHVAALLRHNVVQGERVATGGDSVGDTARGTAAEQSIPTHNAETGDLWRLRLHQHTEMGDNESVKMPPAAAAEGMRGAGCCQSR